MLPFFPFHFCAFFLNSILLLCLQKIKTRRFNTKRRSVPRKREFERLFEACCRLGRGCRRGSTASLPVVSLSLSQLLCLLGEGGILLAGPSFSSFSLLSLLRSKGFPLLLRAQHQQLRTIRSTQEQRRKKHLSSILTPSNAAFDVSSFHVLAAGRIGFYFLKRLRLARGGR